MAVLEGLARSCEGLSREIGSFGCTDNWGRVYVESQTENFGRPFACVPEATTPECLPPPKLLLQVLC